MKPLKILFYLFLASIPFGTRILIHQFTTGFHEYETIFLYASDILMILFLGAFGLGKHSRKHVIVRQPTDALALGLARPSDSLPARPARRFSQKFAEPSIILLVFIIFSAFSIFFAFSKGLAVYNFVRLLLLVIAALATAKILKEGVVKLESIFAIIAASAVFQALLGVAQFIKQSSLGLGILGEPILGSEIGGAAKIVVEGAKILRAYGAFPHPNVLAAFLLLGLCGLYYLWIRANANDTNHSRITRTILVFGIFIVNLGLLLAFSRTAWAIAILVTIATILYYRNWRLTILTASIFAILLLTFGSYIFPRAKIAAGEPAVSYRLAYNKVGLNLLRDRPMGVGIGNQVISSVKNGIYQKFSMDQPWQWQPIHNIYLLIASEIGILGLLMFLFFVGCLLIPNSKNVIVIAMLLSLLVFGLVDHFPWTLQPGRLMLWLVVGLLIYQKEKTPT